MKQIAQVPEFSKSLGIELARAVQILKGAGCSDVYVFGSVVTGATHTNSDIDLAVHGCSADRYFSLLGQLLIELDHPVDLIDLDSPEPFAQRLYDMGKLVRIG